MNDIELGSAEELAKAEALRNQALIGLRADYQITADTRREAGIPMPSYEAWIEEQVLNLIGLKGHYQNQVENLKAELDFDHKQETERINEMWALVYPHDPTGWEYWGQVWRHVRDQRDELRQRIAALERIVPAAQKVLDDCKAVGVEPFGAPTLRQAIEEGLKANGPG